ncbi:MAG: hypothetical protein ACQESF_04605 [Nanobdellota archaeon]
MDNPRNADIQDSIPQNKMRQIKIFILVIIIILTSTICSASPLEEAKQVIDDYYKYSMEKDVDSYAALFDQEYLNSIYGKDNKELFKEIFSYFQIKNYDIDYQYYTESDESMTVFFNIKSTTVIEEEEIEMDKDMVALFTKAEDVKLRYIISQEKFVGQMNKEFVYRTAFSRIATKETDLKVQAKKEGVDLENYKSSFKEKIAEHEKKHSSKKLFWIVLIVALLFIVYRFAIKNDVISKHIKDNKIKNRYLHTRKRIIKFVDKAYIILKKIIVKIIHIMTSLSIKIYKKIKEKLKK